MAEKPQFYQEFKWVGAVDQAESQIIGAKTQLVTIKTTLESIKSAVDADADSSADMITLATQANSLVNHAKFVDFLDFIQNTLEL